MATDRPMQLGMVGLGRMGANLVRRLMRDGHSCVVFDVNADAVTALEALVALGPTALTADHHRRLTALAERDRRVRASGVETRIAPADERLREQAREAARTLAGA